MRTSRAISSAPRATSPCRGMSVKTEITSRTSVPPRLSRPRAMCVGSDSTACTLIVRLTKSKPVRAAQEAATALNSGCHSSGWYAKLTSRPSASNRSCESRLTTGEMGAAIDFDYGPCHIAVGSDKQDCLGNVIRRSNSTDRNPLGGVLESRLTLRCGDSVPPGCPDDARRDGIDSDRSQFGGEGSNHRLQGSVDRG